MKKNYLFLEIESQEDHKNKLTAYKNEQGQYIVEFFGEILDFHFHFGPGPDSEDEKN